MVLIKKKSILKSAKAKKSNAKQKEPKVKNPTALSKAKAKKKLKVQIKEDLHVSSGVFNDIVKKEQPNHLKITQLRTLHAHVVDVASKRLVNIDPNYLEEFSRPYYTLAAKIKIVERKIIEEGKKEAIYRKLRKKREQMRAD